MRPSHLFIPSPRLLFQYKGQVDSVDTEGSSDGFMAVHQQRSWVRCPAQIATPARKEPAALRYGSQGDGGVC